MTARTGLRHTPGVPLRKPIALVLLAFAAAMVPEVLWLGAHVLADHHHHHATGATETHDQTHETRCAEVAAAIAHGHGHGEGVPEHEHDLVLPPALRHDSRFEILRAPAVTDLAPPVAAPPSPAARESFGARPSGLTGSGPPLLALLCTLLI